MINKLIKNRRSSVLYSDRPLEKEKLELLFEAARWAPSCFNNQSWNYVFVHKNDVTRKDFQDALSLGNGWAKKAPYMVAVGADPENDCKNNDLPYYAYNAGLTSVHPPYITKLL